MGGKFAGSRLLAGILFWMVLCLGAAALAADADVNCQAHKGSCYQPLGEGQVFFEIFPKPVKAMQDLTFMVTVKGVAPSSAPVIDLSMPGMHMGPNKVQTKLVAPGVFQGKGVIVRCPSGKRLWQAMIDFPNVGLAIFRFDVVY